MADPRVSLLGNVVPSSAKVSDVFSIKPDTNDRYNHTVIQIDEDNADTTQLSTREGITGAVEIPASYVSGGTFYIVWRTSKTTGDVVWDVDLTLVSGDNTESLDPSTDDENLSVTDSAGGAAHRRMVASVAISGTLAPNATLLYGIYRDGTDGNDTLAGAVWIEEAQLEYAEA